MSTRSRLRDRQGMDERLRLGAARADENTMSGADLRDGDRRRHDLIGVGLLPVLVPRMGCPAHDLGLIR